MGEVQEVKTPREQELETQKRKAQIGIPNIIGMSSHIHLQKRVEDTP